MSSISQAQIQAAIRYAGVALGTVFTTAGALGALSADQAQQVVAGLQTVADDLQKLVGDLWKLSLVLAPLLTFWLARIGWNSASTKSQIAAVQAIPEAQVVVTKPELAEGIPGVQVQPTAPFTTTSTRSSGL